MKKIASLLLTLSLVFCVLLALPLNASAVSTATQDGLEVTITTDKTEYAADEDIQVSVNIKNNNSYKVEDVSIETLLPEGLVLKTGNLSATDIDIEAGTSYSASVVAQLSEDLKDNEETKPDDTTKPEDTPKPDDATKPDDTTKPGGNDQETSSPQTGDNSNIVLWVVLLIASAVGIILTVKFKKTAKMMSLFLCFAMVLTMLPMSAFAAENDTATITVDRTITVGGKEYALRANVKFEKPLDVTNAVSIDKTSFAFNNETNKYSIYENINIISGTLENVSKVSSLTFEVTDAQGVLIDSGNIVIESNWSTEDIGFIVGENTLTVTATYKNGQVSSDTIVSECYFNSKSDKLSIDVDIDTDGDGLVDYLENYAGSDANKIDTDGDLLTDYQEVVLLGSNPCMIDSDQDGISDYDSDYDSDGLPNGYEISKDMNPISSDSDNDLLEDNDELSKYNTDPIKPDTDNDGAKDGWEITNGFDPLVYNDSFIVEAQSSDLSEHNKVSANVSAEINGNQVETLEVTPVDYSDNALLTSSIPGYLGSAYDFSVSGDIETATLVFNYDSSLGTVNDQFQPRIYYFNEEAKELEELPNQKVENGKVSVAVEHFSTYILLNKVKFDKVWDEEIKPPLYSENPEDEATLDIVFVIDYSLSMEWNDEYQLFKSLSEEFINKLRDGKDKAGAVKFIRRATLVSALTTDKDNVITAINGISYDNGYGTYSGTDGSAGIKMALDQMATSDSEYQYIVFITDGEDNGYSYSYDSLIATANESNVTIYAVGMGSASEAVLKKVSSQTGGKYYHATTDVSADDLINLDDVFSDIESETIDLTTDSNNDGIPDYYNELIKTGKLRLSNGSDEFSGIDFNYDANGELSDDYDNDGLKNGQELIVSYNENTGRISMKMTSDPMMKHSDGDGIDDLTEINSGTDPLRIQYSKYYTDWLYNNDNYYYEDYVAMYDDSTIYQLDSAFLATIFGVWNTEELYRDILADYFLDYVEPIQNVQDQEERAVFVDIADDFLNNISNVNEIVGDVRFYKDLVGDVKHLISVANGYTTTIEAISVEYIKIIEQVTTYYPDAGVAVVSTRSMSSTSISVLTKNSPLKTGRISGVSIVFDVFGGAIDMADTISTLAAVNANTRVFEENLDFLIEMRDNGSRINIQNAAQKIIDSLGEGYGNAIADALLQDTGELTVNVLLTVASANPYVKAVVFVRDVIDRITGISAELKIEYQMLAYNCMSYSVKNLIYKDTELYNGYYYSTTGNLERYLTHLAQIRILGERKYDEFYSTGANAWFNDEEEIHEWIEQSIANVKVCAEALDLKLKN